MQSRTTPEDQRMSRRSVIFGRCSARRWLTVAAIWLAIGCTGQPDTVQNAAAVDSGTEPTVRIFVEDSQTYVTQLDYAADRLLVEIIPGAVADAASLAADVGASVASYDDKTRTAVLRVA